MTISKADLRGLVREREAALTPEERRASDSLLVRRFLASPEYRRAGCVLFYAGCGSEPDTRPLIEAALRAGKTAALPRIAAPGVMEARRIGALSELVPDRFGIPAPPPDSEILPPEAFDLILVPGAAFAPDGARLGRGGGYYDRYLPRTRGVKIALARRGSVFPGLPVEEHDVRVDRLITDGDMGAACPPD